MRSWYCAAIFRVVITPVLLLFVKCPVSSEVAAGLEGPQPHNRLGARKTPVRTTQVHPIFDQVPARTLDDAAGDRPPGRKVLIVVQVRLVLEQIVGAGVYRLALRRAEVASCGAPSDSGGHVHGLAHEYLP